MTIASPDVQMASAMEPGYRRLIRTTTTDDLYNGLARACASVGIECRDVPADGQWHRTDVLGDHKGKGDGSIRLFPDGTGGTVCNWKGETETFFADADRNVPADQIAERKRLAERAMAEVEAERARKAAHAVEVAGIVVRAATDANPDHPYLMRKVVAPSGNLYELDVQRLADHLGYYPKSCGEPLVGRILIAPVCIDDRLATLEMIDENGRKSALYGGTKAGGYWCASPLQVQEGPAVVLISEGVATAISLHEATGHQSVAALSCANLVRVAEAVRAKCPSARIVVCADVGNGFSAAEHAARAVSGQIATPNFAGNAMIKGRLPTDFNDLRALEGLDAVRASLETALAGQPVLSVNADVAELQAYGDGRFEVSERGVFYIGSDRDGNEKSPMFLCSKLRIIAKTRDAKSGAWGRLLEWRDDDGVTHRWAMPIDMLQGDGAEVRRELSSLGLTIAPTKAARDMLASYIQVWRVESRARCVDRLGWHGTVYVTADEAIGENGEIVVFQNAHSIEPALSQSGSVESWRKSVAALAAGNTRIVFALSAAFAGPLAEVAGEDSGGFHFRGGSSSGKSTALKVASSVWGEPSAYCRMWRTTTNGLEGLAGLHNDGLLILDELSQIDPKEAGDAAYLLANGQGKVRATRAGAARAAARWRLLFLSAGEESLCALMASVGKRANAGQEIRLAEIEADAGAGMGAFEQLHNYGTPAELAVAFQQATNRNHGAVGLCWLRYIVADRPALSRLLHDGMLDFMAQVIPAGAAGQVSRVARRFALVGIAGELASDYGLTGWHKGEAVQASKACFRAWLDSFGGSGNREDRAILAQVRGFFEAHGASRFEDVHAERDSRVINRAGFQRTSATGGREFLVLPEAFKREVCHGYDSKAVTRVLLGAGWITPGGDGKSTQKPRLPGMGPTRCYVFTQRMWEWEG